VGGSYDSDGQTAGYLDVDLRVDAISGASDELVGAPVASTRRGLNRRIRVLVPAIHREEARAVRSGDRVRILGAQEVRPRAGEAARAHLSTRKRHQRLSKQRMQRANLYLMLHFLRH
jgi:hypothetical protein